MSTAKPTTERAESSYDGLGSSKGDDLFAECIPKRIDANNAMSSDKVAEVWAAIYKAAKISSASEEVKRSLRCACYMYAALNGTSSRGTYAGQVVTGKGTKFSAGIISVNAGMLEVRQFFRGNAKESLEFFRKSDALVKDENIRARLNALGINHANAIAICDWLDYAEGLTLAEMESMSKLKAFSLGRANAARGGQSVETIRDNMRNEAIVPQSAAPVKVEGMNGKF